jgi:hypothetical protein
MKFRRSVGSLLSAALLAGCASDRTGLVLAPVGPAPATLDAHGSNGTLLVFSAYEQGPEVDRPDYRREHSNYRLLSAEGGLLQTVQNDSGALAEGPKPVELPTGTYRVIARANGYGEVTVPVVIRPNEVTAVHLEGGVSLPKRKGGAPSALVRLPDGQVVGWRSPEDAPPKPAAHSATTAAVGARP